MDIIRRFREYTRELGCHLNNMNRTEYCQYNVNKAECFPIVGIGASPVSALKNLPDH